jgi:hypothetical protein
MSFTDRLVERIRAEYMAMPALKLTRDQACRLWGVGHDTCTAALNALIAEGFLLQTGTGKYIAQQRPSPGMRPIGPVAGAATSTVRCPHCGKRNTVERAESAQGRGLSFTMRCVGCQRIISLTQLSA